MNRKMLQIVRARVAIALGLAAAVAAVTVFAGTAALAGHKYPTTLVQLSNVGDEPRAAGECLIVDFYYVTVSCTHLTPGANYICDFYGEEIPFVAKKNGGSGDMARGYLGGFELSAFWVDVYRVDEGGNLVLVLAWPIPR